MVIGERYKNQPSQEIPEFFDDLDLEEEEILAVRRFSRPELKVTLAGNVIETVLTTRPVTVVAIKKLSSDSFLDLRTGEVRDYVKTNNRSQSLRALQRTFKNIRDYVNCNIVNPASARWVTLTYADNMRDPKRLYVDFEGFWKRFKRYCQREFPSLPVPEYLSIVEPQGRGAWHCHCFFIWPDADAPFIPNLDLAGLWRQGYVKIKAVDENNSNMGAYLTAYLADIPLSDVDKLPKVEQKRIFGTAIEKGGKKFIKGGRLCLYPPGFNIFRHSRGIEKPTVFYTTKEKEPDIVGSARLTFSFSKTIELPYGKTMTITKKYYNKKIT